MDPNDQNPMGPSQDQGTPAAPTDDQSGQAGDMMPQAPTEVPPPGPSEEELPPPPPATDAPETGGDQSSQ